MNHLIILMIAFCSQNVPTQQIDWQNTKEWKIYKLRGHGLFSYPLDTLRNFQSYLLNQDSMIQFVADARVIARDSTPVWMGEYVASCVFKDKELKLEFSTYGGFFYCEANQHVYQIPAELKRAWQDYIVASYSTLYR